MRSSCRDVCKRRNGPGAAGLAAILFFAFSVPDAWGQDAINWAFTDYPPANYVVEGQGYGGFLYDIVIEAVEHRLGIPIQVTILPWTRCQRAAEKGQCDMIVTIPTAERLEYAAATESPIWVKRRIVYTYADHPRMEEIGSIRSLEDIRNRGLTVVSYIGNSWAKEAVEGSGITVLWASSVETSYRMLDGKRADLILEESMLADTVIDELGLAASLIATEGVAAASPFHILISRKSPFLGTMDALDGVIEEMRRDGTIARILAEDGMSPDF